jgi:hypothetical protein
MISPQGSTVTPIESRPILGKYQREQLAMQKN